MIKTSVPKEYLGNLNYFAEDTARLLELIVALGGEVFILKAELKRVSEELAAQGVVTAQQLEERGRTQSFREWMTKEQELFAQTILDPIARQRDIAQPGKEG